VPARLSERNRDKIITRILRTVRENRTFFLAGHEKPDGDTIGSELALASLLRRWKKQADIYNSEPVPKNLRFLPGAEAIRSARRVDKAYDVAIILECSGPERMGNIIDLKSQAKTVINIDHHAHHATFGHINLIDAQASSNSELLYYFFQHAELKLSRDEAMCLYVGLVTDTGRFQQVNTNARSHEVAAGLHRVGIDVSDITRRLYNTRTESSLKLLGRAMGSLRLEFQGRVAVISLTQRDFIETSSGPEETEEFINYGLMVPSVQVALFVRETEIAGKMKVSFRGKGLVDVLRVAVAYGGGGHKNAAGCTVDGNLENTVQSVLSRLQKILPA